MMTYEIDVPGNVATGTELIAFETRLASLKAALEGKVSVLEAPFPAVTLVFAVSDGTTRAVTAHGSGADLDVAWDFATAALKKVMARRKLRGRFLRVDWVEKAETCTWDLLRQRLREVKRNYCRKGIALDRGFSRLFLEMEINAQAMLYGGNQVSHCVLNEKNFELAAQQKYGMGTTVDFRGNGEVHVLETAGLFCEEDGIVHELYGNGRNAGRRKIEPLDDETLADIIRNSSDFLARQVDKEGRFVYGYHPYYDDKAFVVDTGNEIKLGANATAILAMTKYSAVLGSDRFAALMEKLALGILHMQAQDGSFTHVLTWPGLEVKEKFRIVYYEGEAAFALMRLYSLTKDDRWIGAVERAFGHFIEKDYWKHHDHWLSYCTNELTLYRPELRYFRFGIQNFEGYLDFVLQRITTFPTLLELMMAGRKMLDRLKAMPKGAELLVGLDEARFDQALHFRAAYLLNGHFWPEYAMFFRHPDQILGSFFIRHHAFRVRIDDVEHYLSGLVALSEGGVWTEYAGGVECLRYFVGGEIDNAPVVIVVLRGFICLVGWVIHDAWRGTLPSFGTVFFTLLLARQTLIFLMMSASTLGVLWRRRERVEALFVADRPFMTQSHQEVGLTELLTEDRRDTWLPSLLAEMSPEHLSLDWAATQWTEQGRVAYLIAHPTNPGYEHSLMIRLFHRSVVGMGHHEAELLTHGTEDWPTPTLLGKRDVEGNLALIFRCWGKCEWAPPMTDRNDTLALRGQILGCEIPDDLALRYLRSRSRLPERATTINWPMFSGMARTASEVADCARVEAAWPRLTEWLRHRPSQIVLPKMAARRMARGANGGRLICNWTHWKWEPLGFDWPWSERPEHDLRQCLDAAAQVRPVLADCLVEDVLLVAVVASFTDRSETGAFSAMLDLLLPLVNAVERCGLLVGDAREQAS
uniref:Poly(Glycerol-phosphate) alpha-glucosyltransferase n=1 Tax=Steinernema glaseri TaxID=37863 RepID=A0A1I8ATN9_9BILA